MLMHQSNIGDGNNGSTAYAWIFKYFRHLRTNVSSVTPTPAFPWINYECTVPKKHTHTWHMYTQTDPFNSFDQTTLAMNKLRKCVFMLDRAYKTKKQQQQQKYQQPSKIRRNVWRTPFNISGSMSNNDSGSSNNAYTYYYFDKRVRIHLAHQAAAAAALIVNDSWVKHLTKSRKRFLNFYEGIVDGLRWRGRIMS